MTDEIYIRFGVFLLAFLVFVSWESHAPRRPLNYVRSRRWLGNVGLGIINQLALYV